MKKDIWTKGGKQDSAIIICMKNWWRIEDVWHKDTRICNWIPCVTHEKQTDRVRMLIFVNKELLFGMMLKRESDREKCSRKITMTYEWHGDGKKICYMCYFVFLSLEKNITHIEYWNQFAVILNELQCKYQVLGIKKGYLWWWWYWKGGTQHALHEIPLNFAWRNG